MVAQQKRNYSTSPRDSSQNSKSSSQEEGSSCAEINRGQMTEGNVEAASEATTQAQLTQRQKLQRAVKEYGSTVIVFHVTISLASLGFFYLLVSR